MYKQIFKIMAYVSLFRIISKFLPVAKNLIFTVYLRQLKFYHTYLSRKRVNKFGVTFCGNKLNI